MNTIFQNIFLYSGLALLLFNMSQRNAQQNGKGEKKRMASLLMAVCLFAFSGSVYLFNKYHVPESFLFFPAGIILVFIFLQRNRIFIFQGKCRRCRRPYSLKDIFFTDSPKCLHGYTGEKKIPEMDWKTWQPLEHAVLCFIRNRENGKCLLIHKKTGLGTGKINAPGGKIEAGESPKEAAIRECMEETGIRPSQLEEMVHLSFQFTDGYSLKGYVFTAESWEGEAHETREADPFWCKETEIPYESMWADDILWLPGMLNGKKLHGKFIFDFDDILDSEVNNNLDPLF